MLAPVKSDSSCNHVPGSPSTHARALLVAGPDVPGSALWVEVVAVAVAWWVALPGESLAPVGAWLVAVRAWLAGDGGASLESVCRAAEASRVGAPWPLAWAVRAATCAVVLEAREAGRWPLWRAVPYRLSLYLHPASLAAEVLEAAADSRGVTVAEARGVWREIARRNGVIA